MECDFRLALLKGLIEHRDGTKYFGSTMSYTHWLEEAKKAGWVFEYLSPNGNEQADFTFEGLQKYGELKLGDLPHTGRACGWDWGSL